MACGFLSAAMGPEARAAVSCTCCAQLMLKLLEGIDPGDSSNRGTPGAAAGHPRLQETAEGADENVVIKSKQNSLGVWPIITALTQLPERASSCGGELGWYSSWAETGGPAADPGPACGWGTSGTLYFDS